MGMIITGTLQRIATKNVRLLTKLMQKITTIDNNDAIPASHIMIVMILLLRCWWWWW